MSSAKACCAAAGEDAEFQGWIFTIPGVALVSLCCELGPALLEEPCKLRRPRLRSAVGNSPFHEQFKSCGKLPLPLRGLSICGKLF